MLRVQKPDDFVSLLSEYTLLSNVYAAIFPMGTQVFFDNVQTLGDDGAPTHRIYIRWLQGLTQYHIIECDVQLPDGSMTTDRYKILRLTDWKGRRRFTCIDAKLEDRAVVPTDA